jgi:hypothetical protein
MAPICKRYSRPGLGGTAAGVKALVLPTVAVRRVLEKLIAYGLATGPSQGQGKSLCGETAKGEVIRQEKASGTPTERQGRGAESH